MKIRIGAAFAAMMLIPLAACDVDQTEEGEIPDVEVEEGDMPEYDVESPDVEVNPDTVTVPDVDVQPPSDTLGGSGMTSDTL